MTMTKKSDLFFSAPEPPLRLKVVCCLVGWIVGSLSFGLSWILLAGVLWVFTRPLALVGTIDKQTGEFHPIFMDWFSALPAWMIALVTLIVSGCTWFLAAIGYGVGFTQAWKPDEIGLKVGFVLAVVPPLAFLIFQPWITVTWSVYPAFFVGCFVAYFNCE